MEEQCMQTANNPEKVKGLYVRRGAERQAQLDKLWPAILGLDRGFGFSGKNVRVPADGRNLYVNLAFYNFICRFDLLINLKNGPLTAQDVKRMEKIVTGYTSHGAQWNPMCLLPIGMIVCVDKTGKVTSHLVPEDRSSAEYRKVLPTDAELAQMMKR